MKRLLLGFGTLVFLAMGQTPTSIGSHQLAETAKQFIEIEHGADYVSRVCRSRKRTDKLECKGLTSLIDGQPGVLQSTDGDRNYHWRFVGAKLYELNITPSASLNFESEVRLLTEKYGPPTETKTVTFQNAYGARWDCPEVSWNMPDGALVQASEYIAIDYNGAPKRETLITFLSKAAIADAQRTAQPQSNPYLHHQL